MIATHNSIKSILPDSESDPFFPESEIKTDAYKDNANKDIRRLNARELAILKMREKQSDAEYMPPAKAERQYNTIEAIKRGDLTKPIIVLPEGCSSLAGTTRPQMTKLLQSLNINLNINLTKTDTYNLLATLLTCNEKQLVALQNNSKVPIVIKIIIKRLIEDYKIASTSTIEMVWDRIFGKGNMSLTNIPQEGLHGILPNQPVSRETYTIIRETLIGREQ